MTQKHTPGPWYEYENGNIWHVKSANGQTIAINLNEANARLIAAAPETAAERDRLKEVNAELMEALQSIVLNFNDGKAPEQKSDNYLGTDMKYYSPSAAMVDSEYIAKAIAVIAKVIQG